MQQWFVKIVGTANKPLAIRFRISKKIISPLDRIFDDRQLKKNKWVLDSLLSIHHVKTHGSF